MVLRAGGHLFIDGDTNAVNDQHRGTRFLPLARRRRWLELLDERRLLCETLGAEFLFVLAPDKQTCFRHLLPQEFTFRAANFMLSHPSVVDPAPLLSALAPLVDVYPRTDSHWDQLGAHIAASCVVARSRLSLRLSAPTWSWTSRRGDLGSKLSPSEFSSFAVAGFPATTELIYDNYVPNNGRIRVFGRPEPKQGAGQLALVFGDSFSYDLVHSLKETVDVLVHVHAFSLDKRLVAALKPDLVICEMTERFVLRFPTPADGEALPVLWLEKILAQIPTTPAMVPGVSSGVDITKRAAQALEIVQTLYRTYEPYLNAPVVDQPPILHDSFPLESIVRDECLTGCFGLLRHLVRETGRRMQAAQTCLLFRSAALRAAALSIGLDIAGLPAAAIGIDALVLLNATVPDFRPDLIRKLVALGHPSDVVVWARSNRHVLSSLEALTLLVEVRKRPGRRLRHIERRLHHLSRRSDRSSFRELSLSLAWLIEEGRIDDARRELDLFNADFEGDGYPSDEVADLRANLVRSTSAVSSD